MSTKTVNLKEIEGLIDQAIEFEKRIRQLLLDKEILERQLERIARDARTDETLIALEDELHRQVRFHWSPRYEVRQDVAEDLFKELDFSTWTELFSVSKVEIGRQRNFEKVLLRLEEKLRKKVELSYKTISPKDPKVEYKY